MVKCVSRLTLCAMVFALCLPAPAQQPKKIPRIGVLRPGSPADSNDNSLRQGLHDLGYVEGKNIAIEYRYAEGKLDRMPELAAELVHLNLDVIVAGNALAVKALKQATTTIPIVIAMYAGDPVADGVVTSFAKPGGNVTGVIPLSPELSGKRLEFLKMTLPKVFQVGVMWNPDSAGTRSQWEETQAAARLFGIKLLSLEVRNPNELDKAIEGARRARVGALVVLSDPLFYRHRKQVAALMEKCSFPECTLLTILWRPAV